MNRPSVEIMASELRRVLGYLPTGVTIITAFTDDGPAGMAANSVTSVSLDPPLILVCPARTSTTWPKISAAGRFCVNVMARHHAETSRRFALKGVDRFADVKWHERPGGPAFGDAVAWIDCKLRDEHDAGDHTIAVADVLGIEAASARRPLVFFRGRYGGFEG
jgi:flavin reductase (DIM6/NTAB) family NADH-FMN oxidoreductase RutF